MTIVPKNYAVLKKLLGADSPATPTLYVADTIASDVSGHQWVSRVTIIRGTFPIVYRLQKPQDEAVFLADYPSGIQVQDIYNDT